MQFRKNKYHFSDSKMSSDQIIAYALASVSLVAELAGFIAALVTKGKTPDVFALMFVCAMILCITGLVFAYYSFKSDEGGVPGKRVAVMLNILGLIIPLAVMVIGRA